MFRLYLHVRTHPQPRHRRLQIPHRLLQDLLSQSPPSSHPRTLQFFRSHSLTPPTFQFPHRIPQPSRFPPQSPQISRFLPWAPLRFRFPPWRMAMA